MRSLRTALALSLASAALAACSDQPTSTPVGPNPPRVSMPTSMNAAWFPTACDIGQTKKDAGFFAKRGNDDLLTIVNALGDEYAANGRTRVATNRVFDALYRIGVMRGTTDQNGDVTALAFDRLVKGLLCFAETAITDGALEPTPAPTPDGVSGFGPALGSHWVFEVRGTSNPPSNYDAPTGGAYERNKPSEATGMFWALEPGNTDSNGIPDWPTSIGGSLNFDRVFVFGYQTSAAAAIPAKFGSSFTHFTIPKISPPGTLNPTYTLTSKLGLCGLDSKDGRRVNHDNVFFPLVTTFQCVQPADILASSSSAIYAFGSLNPFSLAQRVMDFLAPQQLYAALGVVGQRGGTLSPSAVYDLSRYQLSGLQTVADGRISRPLEYTNHQPITLNVTVSGLQPGDPPVPAADGTPVVVSIVGNNSSIAFFKDGATTAPSTATVTRYVQGGVVSFRNTFLTKAGSYQLAFQVALVNTETNTIDFANAQVLVTNTFTYQNK
jgi:hypothetical protein